MRCFARTARAAGCPEDGNILWTAVRRAKLQEQNRGCMKGEAGSEEMSSCRYSTSFTWGTLPLRLGPACSVEYSRCLAEALHFPSAPHGIQKEPTKKQFHEQEKQGRASLRFGFVFWRVMGGFSDVQYTASQSPTVGRFQGFCPLSDHIISLAAV